MKKYLPLIIFASMGLIWMVMSRVPIDFTRSQSIRAPRVGFIAPDFYGNTLDGKQISKESIAGKAVVLNFWASWCPPCRAEMPTLEKMANNYKDKGVVILGLNSTSQDSIRNAEEFISTNNITFPILLDMDGVISNEYQITSLPTTFFISPSGKIVQMIIGGPISEASMIINIEKLLETNP